MTKSEEILSKIISEVIFSKPINYEITLDEVKEVSSKSMKEIAELAFDAGKDRGISEEVEGIYIDKCDVPNKEKWIKNNFPQ